jgi:hypothetical protein
MRFRISLIFCFVLWVPRLEAQTSSRLPVLPPGSRIRIDAPGVVAHHFVGTLLLPVTDSLFLASEDGPPITIRPGQITSLEVSQGKSRLKSGMIGMLLAAPVGYALGHLYSREPEQQCNECPVAKNQREDVMAMMMAGAGIGLVVGAAIGRERWVRVSLAWLP